MGVAGNGGGVGVFSIAGVSAINTSGCGDAKSGIPPSGVGVWYCPHNDALPMQDDIRKDAITEKMTIRFTNESVGEIIPVMITGSRIND